MEGERKEWERIADGYGRYIYTAGRWGRDRQIRGESWASGGLGKTENWLVDKASELTSGQDLVKLVDLGGGFGWSMMLAAARAGKQERVVWIVTNREEVSPARWLAEKVRQGKVGEVADRLRDLGWRDSDIEQWCALTGEVTFVDGVEVFGWRRKNWPIRGIGAVDLVVERYGPLANWSGWGWPLYQVGRGIKPGGWLLTASRVKVARGWRWSASWWEETDKFKLLLKQ